MNLIPNHSQPPSFTLIHCPLCDYSSSPPCTKYHQAPTPSSHPSPKPTLWTIIQSPNQVSTKKMCNKIIIHYTNCPCETKYHRLELCNKRCGWLNAKTLVQGIQDRCDKCKSIARDKSTRELEKKLALMDKFRWCGIGGCLNCGMNVSEKDGC